MRDCMDRRVTPPKRVTSPTWGPPPPCKQALKGPCHQTNYYGPCSQMKFRRFDIFFVTLQDRSEYRHYRVLTHLESPWKSLSFKIKIQGLESPWKLQSALESPWISVLTLSNTDSQVSKRSKHRKTYQGKIAHVVEEPKKTDSRLFFALNGVLEKWEMSPWKSLKIPWIFCS